MKQFRLPLLGVVIAALLCVSGNLPATAHAQTPPHPSLERIGQYSGHFTAVDVHGGFAYVGVGPRLEVFDVTGGNPRFLGRTEVLGTVKEVAVSGTNAFAALGSRGLAMIDVSNTTKPMVTRLITTTTTTDLEIVDNFLYVAMDTGVAIMDISHPDTPLLGMFKMGGGRKWGAFGIAVQNGVAYVGAYLDGLRILNVANPYSPYEIGQYVPQYVGDLAADGEIEVHGNYAFVTNGVDCTVLNIADPAKPFHITSLHDGTSGAYDVAYRGDALYVAREDHIELWDVGKITDNPLALNVKWITNVEGLMGINRLKVDGDRLYIADEFRGLQVFDISEATNPKRTGAYDGLIGNGSIATNGHYVYMAARLDGFRVIDVSRPNNPVTVFSDPSLGIGSLELDQGRQLLYNGGRIMDVSDPTQPVEIGRINKSDPVIRVVDNLAYVAWTNHTMSQFPRVRDVLLAVFDVSNPRNPKQISEISLHGDDFARGLVIAGHLAYVAHSYQVDVIDITDPKSMHRIGSADLGTEAEDLALYNHTMVVLTPWRLNSFDVSDPTAPKKIAEVGVGVEVQLKAISHFAFVTSYGDGVYVFDLADPSKLDVLEIGKTLGEVEGIATSGENVYVGATTAGLEIFRFRWTTTHIYLPSTVAK